MRDIGQTRIIRALFYSTSGLREAWKTQTAFRQEVCLLLLAVILIFFVGDTATEKILLLSSLLLVLMVELLNSGLETAIDRISLERHELSKRAKDFGSAAVFVSLINAAATWSLIIFW